MSTHNRRMLFSCALLLVAACICAAAIAASGAGISLLNRTPSVPPSSPPVSLSIDPQMDQIQAQVESLRGLHATTPVTRGLLTSAQLGQKVVDDFLKNYSEADAGKEATELNAFGWLPSIFNTRIFHEKFLSEQIAGYYDNVSKEMFVITDEGFGGIERFNYSHEYTHVLQDQTFDFQGKLGFSDAKCKNASERCAALQALIEGDAVLSQQQWLIQFSTALDRQQILQFSQSLNTPIYDSAPEFYKQDALFPYTQGLEFVQTLFDRGGWQAVDHAYLHPPVSTEQILHPSLYPSSSPVAVTLPDLAPTLGQGWKNLDTDTLGEWDTYLLLSAGYDPNDRLSTSIAKKAAAGWGGDAFTLWVDSQTGAWVLAVEWKWDTPQDAAEFASAFSNYGNDRWGGASSSSQGTTLWETRSTSVAFTLIGQTTFWIMAPDAPTTRKIAGVITH